MKKNKSKNQIILNISIIILAIIFIVIFVKYISPNKETTKTISEQEYRNAVKANITEEYITKPKENQNKTIQEDIEQQNKLRENEMSEQDQTDLKNTTGNLSIQGPSYNVKTNKTK